MQAQGGARMVRTEPDDAEAAFAAIERSGRQALTEMRHLLGLLRTADEPATLAPHPEVGPSRSIQRRADGRATGRPQVEGPAAALPPGVDVSAYRIVRRRGPTRSNTPRPSPCLTFRDHAADRPGNARRAGRDGGSDDDRATLEPSHTRSGRSPAEGEPDTRGRVRRALISFGIGSFHTRVAVRYGGDGVRRWPARGRRRWNASPMLRLRGSSATTTRRARGKTPRGARREGRATARAPRGWRPGTRRPHAPRARRCCASSRSGGTNREIALELYLSKRTVDMHVRSILRSALRPGTAATGRSGSWDSWMNTASSGPKYGSFAHVPQRLPP